jgi:hypothetical protein
VWYGNEDATAYAETDTYGSRAVWADYAGVYHLKDVNDSAGTADLTNNGTCVFAAGKVGNGVDLELSEAAQYLSGSALISSGNFTMSAWVKPESIANWSAVFGQGIFDGVYSNYVMMYTGGKSYSFIYQNGYTNSLASPATVNPSNGTWYYVTQVYTGSKIQLFWNGTNVVNDNWSIGYNSPGTFRIGRGPESGYPWWFDGMVDEVRMTSQVRTADWLTTEYNNQNAPATFITEGTEEDVGALALTSVINDCTISAVRNITTASKVIFIANRDRIAIKLNDSGTVYLELD